MTDPRKAGSFLKSHPLGPTLNLTSIAFPPPHFQCLLPQFYPLHGSQINHPKNYDSSEPISCSETSSGSSLPPRYDLLALACEDLRSTLLALPDFGLTNLLSAPSPPATWGSVLSLNMASFPPLYSYACYSLHLSYSPHRGHSACGNPSHLAPSASASLS